MTIKNIINNNNKIHPHVPDMGGIETMLRGLLLDDHIS